MWRDDGGFVIHDLKPLFWNCPPYFSSHILHSCHFKHIPSHDQKHLWSTIEFYLHFCRTPTRSDHEVRLSSPPTTHPRHLAQRSNSALLTVPHPQTHTFSESSWQELFKDGNVTLIQWQWQWQIRWQRQRQWQRQRDWKLHIWQSHAPKPIHFLKARDKSYSKTATWH